VCISDILNNVVCQASEPIDLTSSVESFGINIINGCCHFLVTAHIHVKVTPSTTRKMPQCSVNSVWCIITTFSIYGSSFLDCNRTLCCDISDILSKFI
jgi:hypothetical protein